MTLDAGDIVWIPCEVKPGPFSDERGVRLSSPFMEWVGFVPVVYLLDPILEGETKIRAVVVDVQNDRFSARIPGEGTSSTLYGELISKAQAVDTVPT